jgi:hypothetical protein
MAQVGPAEFDRLVEGCGLEFEPELLEAARCVVEKTSDDVCNRYSHASMSRVCPLLPILGKDCFKVLRLIYSKDGAVQWGGNSLFCPSKLDGSS